MFSILKNFPAKQAKPLCSLSYTFPAKQAKKLSAVELYLPCEAGYFSHDWEEDGERASFLFHTPDDVLHGGHAMTVEPLIDAIAHLNGHGRI